MFHRHTGPSFWVSLLKIFKNKPTRNEALLIVWFLLSALETALYGNFKSQHINAQWQMGWALPCPLIRAQCASASTTGDVWQYSSLSAALLLPFMPAWHTSHQMTLLLLTPAPADSGEVRNARRNCSRSKNPEGKHRARSTFGKAFAEVIPSTFIWAKQYFSKISPFTLIWVQH